MKGIDRKKIIDANNPVHCGIDYEAPLSVGNGGFCFTSDITGFQTLSSVYAQHELPLCTMSSWLWHTEPFSSEVFSPSRDELIMTEYETVRGVQRYAVKKFPGNEKIYDWFRENPHRLNAGCIALKDNGKTIGVEEITNSNQELHLWEGYITSIFIYKGIEYSVITVCDDVTDTVSFSVSSRDPESLCPVPAGSSISVEIYFPYGSSKKEASVWDLPSKHTTKTVLKKTNAVIVERYLDNDFYSTAVSGRNVFIAAFDAEHKIVLSPDFGSSEFECSFFFSPHRIDPSFIPSSFGIVKENAAFFWKRYWEEGGFIDFSQSTDERRHELQRRIILSQYLLVIQSCGSSPPQETGLSCNSWYGKFHLEMYPLHTAWLALWNHTALLEKSLAWFPYHLDKAKLNAGQNGFAGARWPKMIGPDAVDSPSPIAPLLVWQQPHILYLLELVYQSGKGRDFLEKYRECVFETAEFMADFAFFDHVTETWALEGPLIPVQEEHKPEDVRNPAFEVEYWRFGLLIAIQWFERLGEKPPAQWVFVAQNMAPLPFHEGVYTAHENCLDTFTVYNKDHPSMLMSLGFIPNERVDHSVMNRTLEKVLECWDYESLWGWDFAMMALTAQRLGDPALAVDLLLKNTPKNSYVANGNNKQSDRKDLPLYLPGNGSLLLAAAHLAATGAFTQGGWNASFENLRPLFI